MNRALPLLLSLVFSCSLAAQEEFSTIEERMTGKEFTDAGLSKLTAEELAALNEWLRSHSVATLDNASHSSGDLRGFENRAASERAVSTIVSRIVGPFSGWDGRDTVFRLENGMIWKQLESGQFTMPETDQAVAVIEPGMFNSWRLRIEGYNRTIRVERIQ